MTPDIVRDPRVLGEKRLNGRQPLALGLDLATSAGYAFCHFDPVEPVTVERMLPTLMYGQLDLSAGAYDSGAIRFVRLRQMLSEIRPDIIFYELIRNTPPGGLSKASLHIIAARISTAAQLAGAFMATAATWAEERNIPCVGLDIGSIKKRATGKGNASKPDMIKAANEAFGTELDIEGWESSGVDNVADAMHLLRLGLEQNASGYILAPPAC